MKISRLEFRSAIIVSLFFSVLIITGAVFSDLFLSGLKWIDAPLHSVTEALGSFTALSLAALMLTMRKNRRMYSYHLLVSCALISIGVLDLLHSLSPLGDSFVWLRSMAGLVGGFLFTLVWLPDRFVQQRLAYTLLTSVSIASITSIVFPVAFPGLLPTMTVDGAFTNSAKAINLLGGFLFLIAAAFFITRYRSGRSSDDLLFFNFCILNGWAGLLFPFSEMWNTDWWFWHLIRLTAYAITMSYIFIIVQSEAKELMSINEDLQAEVSERKRVEERLLEQATLLDKAQDAIAVRDLEHRIIYWNKGAEQLYGWTAKEIMGNNAEKFLYREKPPSLIEAKSSVVKDGEWRGELRQITKNGREIIVESRWTLVCEADGKAKSILIINSDISERKHAEAELRKSEERFRQISESVGEWIWEVDTNGLYTYASPAVEKILGYKPAEIVGKKHFYDLFASDIREQLRETAFEAFAKKESFRRFVNPNVHKNGKDIVILETSGLPILDEDCNLLGYRGADTDITERKRAEEELKQSEEKYSTLIDNMQDGVFIIQDLKILFANEASARMAGYTAKEVLGRNVIEFVAPECRDAVIDRYRRRQAGEDVPREYECCLLHKDGKTRVLVNVNVSRVQYLGREASMITMKDITEKKKIETQLLHAQRMESIGTLAGGIAHDINNVLSPIMLSLYLLKREFKESERQELLDMLEKSTQRGADLVKQIQAFARGVEAKRTDLQVAFLISEISQIAKETFPRSIEVRTEVPKDLWATFGDATQLHQVLMNLCVNARDAMIPDGGVLNISAENIVIDEYYARMNMNVGAKVGQYVLITVSDTGMGIPPEIKDRIFEPFFTTKGPGKGTGLGLSTALAIVKSHGGILNVYSEVGNGTAFKIYLPAIQTDPEVQKVNEQFELPAGHGELVLVVDDEDTVCEITRSVLETNGYRVLTAPDGAAAIPIYEQNKEEIKAVIVDMMLPVMDGPKCIKALRKINPDVKVIAVSGLVEKDRLARGVSYTQAFLLKPYTSDILLKTVHEVLEAKT